MDFAQIADMVFRTCLPGQTGILIAGKIGLCCGDGNGIATHRL